MWDYAPAADLKLLQYQKKTGGVLLEQPPVIKRDYGASMRRLVLALGLCEGIDSVELAQFLDVHPAQILGFYGLENLVYHG